MIIPDEAAIIDARDALRRLLDGVRWEGPPPPLVDAARAALCRLEEAMGEPHTYPTRRERRQGGRGGTRAEY